MLNLLQQVGCVCNNASVSVDGHLRGTPTEGALLTAAVKYGMHACSSNYHRIKEFPFSSDTKTMTVKCVSRADHRATDHCGGGNGNDVFFSKGAVERILQRCSRLHYRGSKTFIQALMGL